MATRTKLVQSLQTVRSRPASGNKRAQRKDLDPALKVWIDEVIVPNLVDEYLARRSPKKDAA